MDLASPTHHYVHALKDALHRNPFSASRSIHQLALDGLHAEALTEDAKHHTLPRTRWYENEIIGAMLAAMTHAEIYGEPHTQCGTGRTCEDPEHGFAYLEQEITVLDGDFSDMFDLYLRENN